MTLTGIRKWGGEVGVGVAVAVEVGVGLGSSQLAVASALGGERWYAFDTHGFFEMDKLDGMLSRVRHAFADFATLHYAWHPDD